MLSARFTDNNYRMGVLIGVLSHAGSVGFCIKMHKAFVCSFNNNREKTSLLVRQRSLIIPRL